MKPSATNITDLTHSYITVVKREQQFFLTEYHFHPEFELVYIEEGSGKKIIGSNISEFSKDEFVLIGPNVPHVWISDKEFNKSKATVVYFNAEIFSETFFKMEETKNLNKLFTYATQGALITGATKIKALEKLEKLSVAKGFEKIIFLFDMLNTITAENEINCLDSKPVVRQLQVTTGRLTHVFDYINSNLKKNIALKDVAGIASLTTQSFCRYFKQKTGKNFIEYLHEARLVNAKKLLMSSDYSVAEIAYQSGFKTASNFNKLFKQNTGYRPTEFRKMTV